MGGKQLIEGVGHAADKAFRRNAAGVPILGPRDATIRVSLATRVSQGAKGTIEVGANGDRIRVLKDGRRLDMQNIFDEFGENIQESPNHMLLDRISVVDAKTGALLAAFVQDRGLWTRTK